MAEMIATTRWPNSTSSPPSRTSSARRRSLPGARARWAARRPNWTGRLCAVDRRERQASDSVVSADSRISATRCFRWTQAATEARRCGSALSSAPRLTCRTRVRVDDDMPAHAWSSRSPSRSSRRHRTNRSISTSACPRSERRAPKLRTARSRPEPAARQRQDELRRRRRRRDPRPPEVDLRAPPVSIETATASQRPVLRHWRKP